MQLTETHNRDHVPTPAELPAALGIPPGPQEEADIYISEVRPDEIHLNAPFGVMEGLPRLSGASFARSLICRAAVAAVVSEGRG